LNKVYCITDIEHWTTDKRHKTTDSGRKTSDKLLSTIEIGKVHNTRTPDKVHRTLPKRERTMDIRQRISEKAHLTKNQVYIHWTKDTGLYTEDIGPKETVEYILQTKIRRI
jgi:hypothetical protein